MVVESRSRFGAELLTGDFFNYLLGTVSPPFRLSLNEITGE